MEKAEITRTYLEGKGFTKECTNGLFAKYILKTEKYTIMYDCLDDEKRILNFTVTILNSKGDIVNGYNDVNDTDMMDSLLNFYSKF